MLANLVGIVGGREIDRVRIVSAMLDEMPHGEDCLEAQVVAFADGCIGWQPIVWKGRNRNHVGVAELDGGILIAAVDGRLDAEAGFAEDLGVERGDWSQLVGRGYQRQGESVFSRIEGDFACAIYDCRAKRIVLARDFSGARPIYWSRLRGGGLAFASYARAALHLAGLPFVPKRDALWREALRINLDQTPSLLEGVELLPRNSCLVYGETGETCQFELYAMPPMSGPSHDKAMVVAYRSELVESVTRRCAPTPELQAVTLSGGLDSAAVLGATRHVLGRDATIRAITIAPFGKARADLAYASDAARLANAEWHCLESKLPPVPDNLIRWHGSPFAAAHAGTAWEAVAGARAAGSQSLLVGSGGDYLGGDAGNWAWWSYREDGLWGLVAALLQEDVTSPTAIGRAALGVLMRAHLPWMVPRRYVSGLSRESASAYAATLKLFAADSRTQRTLEAEIRQCWRRMRWPRGNYSEQVDAAFGHCVERELMSWDFYGRLVGVEIAHPIVTRQIYRIARSIGPKLRRHQGRNRLLLREAASDWLPDSIRERRGKSLYDDHFLELWQRQLAQSTVPFGERWNQVYSMSAWNAARESCATSSPRLALAIFGAFVVSKWIELNKSGSSGN